MGNYRFETTDPAQAVEALINGALPATLILTHEEVINEFESVRASWMPKELLVGSPARMRQIVLKNIKEIPQVNTFESFIVEAILGQRCAQLSVIFKGPFAAVRLWRENDDRVYACNSPGPWFKE